MDVDAVQTAAAVMPYVTAAVTAYGLTTLDKVRDAVVDKASDATVGQIRKALAADPDLARDVVQLLPAGSVHNEASGTRSIAIGTNAGIANTGDNPTFHR